MKTDETVRIANRYTVQRLLGEGGMGKVYEVEDSVHGTRCALKVLSQKISSEEALLQFRQEFWFMTRLAHPHIIQVHEYGVLDDQTPYFTMEIVPGQELSELSNVSSELAYDILIQSAQALGFIHSRRLVHADIKPENLRLTPDQQIKLMDFGLMQAIDTRSNGQLTGTVAYMAPEIPQRGVINESSDIYALGVMAYELLAGVQPFVGTTVLDVIKAHINSQPAPLHSFREDIPEALVRIVHKMLEKSQTDRYANTSELLEDLAQASGKSLSLSAEGRNSYLSSHVLVARDQELDILQSALDSLSSSSASVFIGAPAGVGKSRLIEEFKIKAQLADVPFCQGICVEQGMASYAPVVQALNQVIPLSNKSQLERFGPVLAHLLPQLEAQDIFPREDFDPRQQKITLFETVVAWLKEVARERPLVIFVDDLHWSDMASVELFNYCIRGLNGSSVFMLGSFRDDELLANNPLWQTLEEDLSRFVKLSPFNEAQMAELIEKMLRDVQMPNDFIPYFYGATSGNAFFIREMLRYLMEENLIRQSKGHWIIPDNYTEWKLPTSIADTIKQRLKRLSGASAQLVQKLAVVGKRIELALIEALAEDKDQLFIHLEELVERQFLLRESDAIYFPHDRVRESLYSALEAEPRKDIHQQVGEWLEQAGAGVSPLAYHFKNGRDRVKAFQYLIKAGEEASVRMESTLLMHEGLLILEKLRNLPAQAELLDKHRRELAWISYMIHPFICAETNEKIVAAQQEASAPLEEQVEFESILISSYTMIGRNNDALAKAQELLKQLKPETVPYGLILFSRLNALLTRGEMRQLVTEMESAATILKQRLKRLPRQLVWAYAFCCFIREDAIAWLGEPVGQDHYADVPREIGEQYDFLDLIFWSHYPQIVRNSLIGQYHDIKNLSDDIFSLIKKMGRPIQHENRFQICLAYAAIEHGELEEGAHYAEKVIALGQRMQNKHQQASGNILQGMIAEQKNHLKDAEAAFKEAVRLSRESETDQLLPGMYRLAHIYLKQNQPQKAEPLLQEALELATGFRLENPYHQIQIYRLLAQLKIQQQQAPDQIEQDFKQSLELAEVTQNPLQYGLGAMAYARWLGSAHDKRDFEAAHDLLVSARQRFRQIQYARADRSIQELQTWLRKQARQAEAQSDLSQQFGHQLAPQQAQEIGYKMLEMLSQYAILPQAAPGTGGQKDLQQLSERLKKVERINQFSQLIMQSLDLQIVLQNIMDYVVDIARADRGLLMLKNDLGELEVQVVRLREEEALPKEQLLSFSQSFAQKGMEQGQSLWVKDAQSDQELSQQASIMALDLRTLICVPLKREDEVIGLVYLDKQAVNDHFSEQDLELVESMATFASISLSNARLHAEIQERNEHLQMLNELSRNISTTQDFSELLAMVLEFCLRITRAEIGYIFISEDINSEPANFQGLSCQASMNQDGQPLPEVLVSQSSIQRVLDEKQALCVVDMQDEAQLAHQKSVMALELRSVMCVPIYGKKEQILGVVYVSSQAVSYTFTPRDLELMESIIRQVGMDIENRSLMEIRKKQELLNQELSFARNIQSSMLPDYQPDIPSLDITGFSESAEAVGGDYYDYFKISDTEFGLAIGDVNGHGISASLLMSMAKSCLFVQGKIDPSVVAVMSALNGMIFGGTKERLFMTFVYSIFDLLNHTVTLSSAGHHLPYHYKAKEKRLEPVQVKPTYPLGVRDKARFNEVTLKLEPGDVLVYYTDGIIEAHTPDGEEFGFERLEALILEHHHRSASDIQNQLIRAYNQWIQGQDPEDDMTLVVVKARNQDLPDSEPKLKTGFLTLINR